MNILHLGVASDAPFMNKFKSLLPAGTLMKTTVATPTTRSELLVQLDRNKNIDAVITTNPAVVKLFSGNTKATLDTYAGSVFRIGNRDVPLVVFNDPAHLFSVPYGVHLAQRYLRKIVAPESYYSQSAFSWEIADHQTLPALFEKFKQDAWLLAVDIETVRKNLGITCVGYCAVFKDGTTHSIVIPCTDEIFLIWIRRFNELEIPKIMQNGSYDNSYFLRYGIPPLAYYFDTLHLFHSWYSEMPKSLDFLVAYLLREFVYWKDESAGATNLHDYYRYNAKDTWATANCFLALMKEMPEWAIENYKIEFPMVFPALHMSMEGFKIDLNERARIAVDEAKKLEDSLTFLRRCLGKPEFNPGSPKQVSQLFKVLGSGDITGTGAKERDKVAARHPLNAMLVGQITKYREAQKLLSSYMDAELLNGRFMYSFAVAGTDTGRLASKESSFWCGSNMQNIPEEIKSMFVFDDGWEGADIDYAQSEARCVAYLSGDTKLIDVVESDKDYHSLNAAMFFGVPYEEVTKDLRNLAKKTNHGANYNMGARVMLDTMGIENVLRAKRLLELPLYYTPLDVCQHLLNVYSQTYPVVKGNWYNQIIRAVVITQKLVSPLGWTRYCFGNPQTSKPALNAYVAHVPQNLSVQIINKALLRIWKELALTGRIRLKAQIHDSIVFQYRPWDKEVVDLVREMMRVPVQVTCSKGITRTLLIPNDADFGLLRWKEPKL